jgi:hypothetical protein
MDAALVELVHRNTTSREKAGPRSSMAELFKILEVLEGQPAYFLDA